MKALSELWLAIREDAQFAFKSLARVPTYTATVVLTLALAIGGLTAVFSVLYAVVLRPLPFPNSGDLLVVHETFRDAQHAKGPSSPGEFLDIKSKTSSFSAVAAYTGGSTNLTGQGEAVRVSAAWASAQM